MKSVELTNTTVAFWLHVLVCVIAIGVKAADFTWLPTAACTKDNPYEWDSPANWQNGNVPKGADISCTMKGAAFSGSNTMYIKFPDEGLTLGDLKCVSTSANIYFVGGMLTLKNSTGESFLTGVGSTGHYYHFLCPVVVANNLYFNHQYRGKFYAPLSVDGDVRMANGLELYTSDMGLATGGIYENFFPTNKYEANGNGAYVNIWCGDFQLHQKIAEVNTAAYSFGIQLPMTMANMDSDATTGAMAWVDVENLVGSENLTVSTDNVYNPWCFGTTRIHDVSSFTGGIVADMTRLWFYRDQDGSDPSVKSLTFKNVKANASIYPNVCLYVPEEDETLTVGSLIIAPADNGSTYKHAPVLRKFGPGRICATKYLETVAECTVEVYEGALCLSNETGIVTVNKLVLKDGVTLEIPAGVTLNVGTGDFKGHITVKGPGRLNVSAYSGDTAITKLTYANDAKYTPDYNETDRARVQTVPEVRGTPALWLDANDLGKGLNDAHGETSAEGYVSRWTDTRAQTGDEGYLSATNSNVPAKSYRPILEAANVPTGGKCVSMGRNYSPLGYDTIKALFWNQPLTNITHVFMVADPRLGGGQFLGTTTRLVDMGLVSSDSANEPFYRGHWDWNDNGNFINAGNTWNPCKNGTWRNNGVKVDPTSSTAWGDSTGGKLIEFHPAGTVPADSFAAGVNPKGGNGQSVLCEVIVYTNVLSDVDRRCVAAYLMKKWFERAYDPSDDITIFPKTVEGDGEISVGGGEMLSIGRWAANGMIAKGGEGTLEISHVQAAGGGVSVKGGTVRVVSNAIISEDELPPNPALHLDATKDCFDTLRTSGGTNFIGRWRDVRDNAPFEVRKRSSADTLPWVREDALNGLPMLDFGPLGPETYGETGPSRRTLFQMMKAPTTTFENDNGQAALPDAAVTFQVFGSEYGGNTIFDGPTIAANAIAPRETADPMAAVVNSRLCTMAQKGVFSLNGREYKDPTVAYLSGKFDLISWRQAGLSASGVDIATLAFSRHQAKASGGQLLGEVLVYTNQLEMIDYMRVQSYLHNKWFGDYLDGYRPSEMASLLVAPEATFELEGGRMVLSTIGGGGTLSQGDFVLSAGGIIELFVNTDGTVTPLTIGAQASLAVLGGGTVRLTGSVNKLGAMYTKVILGNVMFAPNGVWSVEGYKGRKILSLESKDGVLYLSVKQRGLIISVR